MEDLVGKWVVLNIQHAKVGEVVRQTDTLYIVRNSSRSDQNPYGARRDEILSIHDSYDDAVSEVSG